MKYEVGMIIETKKPHVCKSNLWEILRTGVDIKMRCTGCNREIMIPRIKLNKIIKNKK